MTGASAGVSPRAAWPQSARRGGPWRTFAADHNAGRGGAVSDVSLTYWPGRDVRPGHFFPPFRMTPLFGRHWTVRRLFDAMRGAGVGFDARSARAARFNVEAAKDARGPAKLLGLKVRMDARERARQVRIGQAGSKPR